MQALTERSKMISRFKKERFLRLMSEEDFRDRVIRPLLLRRGFKDGRDMCGPSEKGKDSIFLSNDPLGVLDIYTMQTKKGNLNLAKKTSSNIVETITQLKTALATPVVLLKEQAKKYPTKAILCASGKINDHAQEFILSKLENQRIVFMDVEEIIPLIDETIPELWFEMDLEILPYLQALKATIEDREQLFTKTEFMPNDLIPVAASEQLYVPLHLYRYTFRPKKVSGKVQQEPFVEDLPITGITSKPQPLVLIMGSAGSGKTTALLRIAYTIADRTINESDTATVKIPVFLRSQELSETEGRTLLDYSSKKTIEVSRSKNSAFSLRDLESGKVVILIDALDEVSNRDLQEDIAQKILDFHELYPKCQVIVSSRDYSFIEQIQQLRKFAHYFISPINYKQAYKILSRLQKRQSLPIDKAQELLRRLQDVHGMDLNPLLITVFAASSDYSRADVPANITELFKKFTELMLGRWDIDKGLSLQYQAPLKDFILQKIGFEMHRRRVTKLSIAEFKDIAAKELGLRGYKTDINLLVDEMLFRNGLFRILDDVIEFRHLMLQEFFAGRGIPGADALQTLICDDWWRRAAVFYFGENPERSDILAILQDTILTKTPAEIFNALVTLGLALQAAYLVELDRKISVFCWLVNNLAEIQRSYEKEFVSISKFPLTAFLNYYIFARDSVALSIVREYWERCIKLCKESPPSSEVEELRSFWIIIALIEIGAIDQAEKLIQRFQPKDNRLLLAIHLGCFLLHHTRVATKKEKETAERICNDVSINIGELRKKVIDEFRSELLELRQKAIEAVKGEKFEGDMAK